MSDRRSGCVLVGPQRSRPRGRRTPSPSGSVSVHRRLVGRRCRRAQRSASMMSISPPSRRSTTSGGVLVLRSGISQVGGPCPRCHIPSRRRRRTAASRRALSGRTPRALPFDSTRAPEVKALVASVELYPARRLRVRSTSVPSRAPMRLPVTPRAAVRRFGAERPPAPHPCSTVRGRAHSMSVYRRRREKSRDAASKPRAPEPPAASVGCAPDISDRLLVARARSAGGLPSSFSAATGSSTNADDEHRDRRHCRASVNDAGGTRRSHPVTAPALSRSSSALLARASGH